VRNTKFKDKNLYPAIPGGIEIKKKMSIVCPLNIYQVVITGWYWQKDRHYRSME
jgi:hypothetical protein